MYRSGVWAEEEGSPPAPPPPPPPPRSRSSSRRSSGSSSRRSSLKKEKKESPLNSAPASASSTPKKSVVKPANLEFLVTGKQIGGKSSRSDRANSLPGSYHRRQSVDVGPVVGPRGRKLSEVPRRPLPAPPSPPTPAPTPRTPRPLDDPLEDDMSLDLSQVSDFEDLNSKYGIRQKFATSTPLPTPVTPATSAPVGGAGRGVRVNKPRSASLQSQLHAARVETRRAQHSLDKQSLASSRDSSVFYTSTNSGSPHRGGAELDYSSVSPEYSGQSSAELSPRTPRTPRTLPTRASLALSPRSQDLQLSSCCVSTWAECSETGEGGAGADSARGAGGAGDALDGEWCAFWANYNNSLASAALQGYYERCPTPYRTDTVDLADWEFSDGSRKRSPDNVEMINNIIRTQGLHLTPRETQNMIKCAHLLGNVLTRAIERRARASPEPEVYARKKSMTLPLKETSIPLEVKPEKTCESATTQTDISLPNTKSAPRIFENILRQLSRSSIDVDKIENKEKNEASAEPKCDGDGKRDAKNELKKEE